MADLPAQPKPQWDRPAALAVEKAQDLGVRLTMNLALGHTHRFSVCDSAGGQERGVRLGSRVLLWPSSPPCLPQTVAVDLSLLSDKVGIVKGIHTELS